jgi:hypothetical protein
LQAAAAESRDFLLAKIFILLEQRGFGIKFPGDGAGQDKQEERSLMLILD